MASETAQVKPSNRIVYDTTNLHYETKKVETATSVYPGRLVKRGTNDDDIVVNTAAGAAVGWAGYIHTGKEDRPATVDTIYVQDDQIAVVYGPGIGIVGSLASGQNVTKGTLLMAAASGELSGATAGTHHVVARAAESVDASSGAADIMVVSLI